MGSQLIGKTWHVSIRSQQALRTFARPADDKLKVGNPIVFGRRSSAMIMLRQTTGSRSCDCQPVGCHRAQADDEHDHNRIEIKMEFDRQAWHSPRVCSTREPLYYTAAQALFATKDTCFW